MANQPQMNDAHSESERLRLLLNDPIAEMLKTRYWGPRPSANPWHQWRPIDAPLVLLGLFEKVANPESTFHTALSVMFRYLDDSTNVLLSCALDVKQCRNTEDINAALNVPVFAVVDFDRPPDLRYPLLDWRRVGQAMGTELRLC